MTTLITGGASQTGIPLAKLLKASNRKVLFASRSGKVPDGFDAVKFDWNDPTTFEAPFEKDPGIQYVYLLPPPFVIEVLDIVKPFIDLAARKGVKRFVLLSGSPIKKGADQPYIGKVHDYLERKGLDYVALLPTWFLENFKNFDLHSIKTRNVIEARIPTARIPWISVEDIGRAAFDAIVAEKVSVRDQIIIGPDYLSFKEVAEILSKVTGRDIVVDPIKSREESVKRLTSIGVPLDYSEMLTAWEADVEAGSEEQWRDHPNTVVGKIRVQEWIKENKDLF